jgi:hypothetical protein
MEKNAEETVQVGNQQPETRQLHVILTGENETWNKRFTKF